MIKAIWDEAFKRSYKKRIHKNEDLRRRVWQRMDLFVANPFSTQLRTHKLSGKLGGLWAFSVDNNCKVVFEFTGEDRALLIDVGSHDEVYADKKSSSSPTSSGERGPGFEGSCEELKIPMGAGINGLRD